MDTLNNSWTSAEANNFRNPFLMADSSRIFSTQGPQLNGFSAAQNVSRPIGPPVPPRPYGGAAQSYNSFGNSFGNYNSFGGGGYSGFGGFGMSGMPGMYGGGYNRYGGLGYGYNSMGGGDAENRFIQIAEENSKSVFQSIESVVSAALNIAQMLDSTYFALTSSFRAVLGVAANFGSIRGLFSQFWTSFALLRGLNWLYKKILYTLRISNIDPSSAILQEAYAAAEGTEMPPRNNSSLAVLAFLSFIMIGPYLLMKLIGTVSNTAIEETKNPKSWTNPIEAVMQYDFVATSSSELSVRAGQNIMVAPKNVQNTHKLLDSGWVLASIDGVTSGLIPVNYIESSRQAKAKMNSNQNPLQEPAADPSPTENLSAEIAM